jgi:FkbM family methyltransferase
MNSGQTQPAGGNRLRNGLRSLYHRLLALGSGGKGLKRSLPGGEIVYILPAYRYTKWNPIEYETFKACLKSGDVGLDIGANAGNYSLLFGFCVGPTGKVFAFEPAPEAFAGLTRHLELNALKSVVWPVQAALSDRPGEAHFLAHGFQGGNRLLGRGERVPAEFTLRVPCLTVDDFCAARKITPDFIKIDVEGYELAVLRGARQTIKAAQNDFALFVELHPGLWPRLGWSRQDLELELAGQGLVVDPWEGSGDPWSEDLGVALRIRKQSQPVTPDD